MDDQVKMLELEMELAAMGDAASKYTPLLKAILKSPDACLCAVIHVGQALKNNYEDKEDRQICLDFMTDMLRRAAGLR